MNMSERHINEIIAGLAETRVRHVGEWRMRGRPAARRWVRPITHQIAWVLEDYDLNCYADWQGAPSYTVWERDDGKIGRRASDIV